MKFKLLIFIIMFNLYGTCYADSIFICGANLDVRETKEIILSKINDQCEAIHIEGSKTFILKNKHLDKDEGVISFEGSKTISISKEWSNSNNKEVYESLQALYGVLSMLSSEDGEIALISKGSMRGPNYSSDEIHITIKGRTIRIKTLNSAYGINSFITEVVEAKK